MRHTAEMTTQNDDEKWLSHLDQQQLTDVVVTSADDSASTYPPSPEQLPAYAQFFIIVAYSSLIVVAVGGNCLVVFTVVSRRSMRTVTNWFIVNLACADTLMAVLCIPMTFISDILLGYWPFTAALCPVFHYAMASSVLLGAFTLVAISIDRHRVIRDPLRAQRLSTPQLVVAMAAIWAAALLLPVPLAVFGRVTPAGSGTPSTAESDDYTTTMTSNSQDDVINGKESESIVNNTMTSTIAAMVGDMRCEESWPDGRLSAWRQSYSMAILVSQYFLPLAVLIATYFSIGYIVWLKRRPPGEALTDRDRRMTANKKKMVKMMITVVIVYALCWLPLHVISLASDADESLWEENAAYMRTIWIGAHWLAMSNCCYNPFVYYWMSSNFRKGYVDVLQRFCCCCCAPLTLAGRGSLAVTMRANGVSVISHNQPNRTADICCILHRRRRSWCSTEETVTVGGGNTVAEDCSPAAAVSSEPWRWPHDRKTRVGATVASGVGVKCLPRAMELTTFDATALMMQRQS